MHKVEALEAKDMDVVEAMEMMTMKVSQLMLAQWHSRVMVKSRVLVSQKERGAKEVEDMDKALATVLMDPRIGVDS